MKAIAGFFSSILLGALLWQPAGATEELSLAEQYRADAAELCDIVREHYAYYESRAVSWEQACVMAQEEAQSVTTPSEGLAVIERQLEALWDSHVHPGVNSATSPRLVPTDTEIWLEEYDGLAWVTAVRGGSAAEEAGVRIADIVKSINGVPIEAAAMERIRTDPVAPERYEWALNKAVAGYHGSSQDIVFERVLASDWNNLIFSLSFPDKEHPYNDELVSGHMNLDMFALVRFNNSLGEPETVNAFNELAEQFRDAAGWIIDLRDTPSGGNTDVIEPIMGRFYSQRQPYQLTVWPGQVPIPHYIEPVGPWTVEVPVVVLVGRWTGSVGEGMAIGFDGTGRADVIGSPMAGLAGGTERFVLEKTKTPIWLPVYDLTHVDGTARHEWMPEESKFTIYKDHSYLDAIKRLFELTDQTASN